MIRRILGVAALTAVGVAALASPAQAGEVTPAAPWQTSDAAGPAYPFTFQPAQYSAVLSPNSALLQVGGGIVGGTELRTDNLDLAVEAGAEVSFHYTLDGGATCSLGAPRLFLYTAAGADTMATAPWVTSADTCGTDGTVTITVPGAATLGTVGFAFDNGSGGSVLITDLTVAGELVLFQTPESGGCDSGYGDECPAPTPSAEPTPTAGPSPSAGPAESASPTPDDDKQLAGLPVTGPSTGAIALAALLAVAIGAVLYAVARRRRIRFTAS